MRPAAKVKASYGLMLFIVAAVIFRMAEVVIHHQGEIHSHIWRIPILLFDLLLGYTLIRILWSAARQGYGMRSGLRLFRAHEDALLSKQFQEKYRNWNTEIIVVREDAFVGLTIGLRRPRIVLSTGVLERFTEEEVEAILLHERHHCQSRDNLKLFLSTLLADAFGYLPIIKPVLAYAKTWRELFADRYAIEQMGTSLHLGSVLWKMIQLGVIRQRRAVLHFMETAIDYRMMQIIEPDEVVKVPLRLYRPLLVTCCFLLLMMLGGSS
ncbi:M56 family metallopeptidase [Gorillibacterium timonense]|uniref:M56 family metallopeptidase n=1 Tax=Gorillibacterium timonense TaxID=1689269 RepID=UPI00071E320D|nr:M56 family metallopeptidase [Gorillibacterium timonense]